MPDPTTLAAVAGGATTLGAGFFGWLRGRADSTTAQAKAQSDQLATLAKIVEQQSGVQSALMDRAQRQSEKISVLSSKLDEVRGALSESRSDLAALQERLAEVEAQRDTLRTELSEAQEQIGDLSEHVRALQSQVEGLGHQPAPAPRNKLGQFSKTAPKPKGRKS